MVLANYERNEMGLSASQARLLTITSRKSDCEFQSMRYSHEKIALSRNMTDISNEYQNALNQTKLVYDFYGTNDKSTPLSYGLMMEPSIMNNYLPMLTTNSAGKVVLDSKLAAAARAAGIPNEGLGTLPSEYVRNKFLEGLGEQNVITPIQLENFKAINYNQSVGQGNTDPITQNVYERVQYSDLLKMVGSDDFVFNVNESYKSDNVTITAKYNESEQKITDGSFNFYDLSTKNAVGTNITLKQLLEGDYALYGRIRYKEGNEEVKEWNKGHIESAVMREMSECDVWDDMIKMFISVLGVDDSEHQTALDYAIQETEKLYKFDNIGDINATDWDVGKYKNLGYFEGSYSGGGGRLTKNVNKNSDKATNFDANAMKSKDYIGYVVSTTRSTYGGNPGDVGYKKARTYQAASINVSNVARAFVTYFAEAMSGFENYQFKVDNSACDIVDFTGSGGLIYDGYKPITNNQARTVKDSKFVTKDSQFGFDIVADTTVNTGEALLSSFYDALFNQLCQRGWVENDKVRDNDYLQEMYKNGMLFLTTCTDDGFYWQGNYAANSMIKEVTDEDAIARAEAKYNTEKQKINHKEEIIDLKMKNLDTEISSLSTEYDTIKSLISKNIERGFKRYDA